MFTAREHSSRAYMKFEHPISEGTYHTEGPRKKDTIVSIVQCKNCKKNRHYALTGIRWEQHAKI